MTASRIAIAAFIIPYIFALNPVMVLIGATPLKVLQILFTSLAGMLGIGAAMEGYFLGLAKPWERVLYLSGGLLLIDPAFLTDVLGILLIGLALLLQYLRGRRAPGK